MQPMEANKRRDRRWMIVFLIAALCLVATRWHGGRVTAGLVPVATRKPVPEMTLPLLGDGEWKLADHRGQVVLINYWATWCEPCRDELPGLLRVARETVPQGVAMVGVSFDNGSGQARALAVESFVKLYRVPYPIAFPDAQLDLESRDIALPTTMLVDRHGRAAKVYVGEVDCAILTADISALLTER